MLVQCETKYEQDSIVFEWFKYLALWKSDGNVQKYWFCLPLNPYKQVEMYKNYCTYVPDEFQLDELYAEPSAEVWAKVKTEKIDRAGFWGKLKVTKYSNDKERLEMALDEGEGIDEGEGKAYAGGPPGRD